MKNSFKKSIAVAFSLCIILASTVSSFASNPTAKDPKTIASSVYAKLNTNKITVGVKSEEKGKLFVRIFNEEGNKIYTDVVANSEGFMRTYDLSENGPGTYTVKVSNANSSVVKKVEVGKVLQKESFKAYFTSKLRDNKIKVTYYGAHIPASVILLDKSGKMISKQVISRKKDNSSIINLTQLNPGNYTLRIDSNGQGIEKQVFIN